MLQVSGAQKYVPFAEYRRKISGFENVKLVKGLRDNRLNKLSAKGLDFLFEMLLNPVPNKRLNIHDKIDYLGLQQLKTVAHLNIRFQFFNLSPMALISAS
jgi:hypothetical protein